MGPETLIDLDPPIGPAAAPTPPPLLPMTRAYLWVCALACEVSAAMLGLTLDAHPDKALLVSLYAAVGVAAALGTRLATRRQAAALTGVLVAITLAIAGTTLVLGWGLSAPGLPICGLMVCVLCAAAGWRAGALLAAVAALAVLVVAAVSPSHPAAGNVPADVIQLCTHLIAIASGLACGVMISQVMARYMRAAHEREERFRRLLALAADAYWEVDPQYRLVSGAAQRGASEPLSPARGGGAVPWELPQFACDADTLDELQADMDTRVPFRDLPVRWALADGEVHDYLVSGEPRFDERGVFTGYWGVARDITAVQEARAALAATETRYRELFTRIPTPLVLHRGGRVLDANPAALALFEQTGLDAFVGHDLLAFYESGDSRERARQRMESLHGQPLGTALPVTDFKLQLQGREAAVRATSVRVDAEGGPALLAIFVDDTERQAAENAVRRSETMLSHLVATSPDLITLTDIATGRYAMVNRSFERVSGWTAAEAVGRTSIELGIWGSDQARDDFVRRLREDGVVSDMPVPFVSKHGTTFSLIVSAARFVMDRRDYMVINARDVTEKERERLERDAILFNASVGIAVTREQRFVLANRHFEEIYGWSSGELVGQPGMVVWSSAEDYAEVGALVGPALARGELIEIERAGRRKDGSSFVARVRGRAIDPSQPARAGTVWIVEDITERRQFEQALARARDAAEAANRAKSAFLANTSHELRTPLNGMIGLARLARDPELGEERRRQYLEQIAQSAQSLAGIISDILDLSKIEAGKLLIETLPFDLAAELVQIQRAHAAVAEARGLELQFVLAPELAGVVQGDPLRVRQIAGNFLANALKFTHQGWVRLHARRLAGERADWVRIEVQDSGPGIDAATRARLFKPFTQADESTTRRYGGTGLGLSICRELAGLMGGSVGVDSLPGVGSTFWAELPLPPTQAEPPLALPAGAGGLEGLRVLMVEDNAVNMLIAVAMLERWGVQVAQAHDGREAVAAVLRADAAGHAYDAVLMDVQMPVMSGHEATRALREVGLQLPIIALTAAALVTEREEALRVGMNDFLTKPIDADKLHATLMRWCAVRA